ncbi:MAG: hypothetical protein ACRETO_05955, partial [Gammaproteobacteria bacterium]
MSMQLPSLPKATRLFTLFALGITFFIAAQTSFAQAPGGFLENDDAGVARPLLTPSQIAGFIPSRGAFTFPAPYNT